MYDAKKLKKILNKAELNLSEKKKELADLEESFNTSEKIMQRKWRNWKSNFQKQGKRPKKFCGV